MKASIRVSSNRISIQFLNKWGTYLIKFLHVFLCPEKTENLVVWWQSMEKCVTSTLTVLFDRCSRRKVFLLRSIYEKQSFNVKNLHPNSEQLTLIYNPILERWVRFSKIFQHFSTLPPLYNFLEQSSLWTLVKIMVLVNRCYSPSNK